MKNPFKNLFKAAETDLAQKPPKQPERLTSEFVRNIETEKLYETYLREFSQLTTDNLRFYFTAARKGINFFKAYLFEEIRRRDLRIGGICETRKLSVLSNEWDVEGDNQEHVDFIKDNFNRINLQQLMSDMIDAQLQGMSVFQLFYEIVKNKMYLTNHLLVPNYMIYAKDEVKFIDFSRIDTMSLRSQASVQSPVLPFIDIDPVYTFEVYSFDGNEENGLLNGLIDGIIYGFYFKVYGLKDWSVFMERWANPALLGKYDPLMSKADRDALWNAVNNFGNLFRGMIPNTAELNTLSDSTKGSTGSGGGVFDTYIGYWDDSLAIRVLGEAMTTDTSEGGSYAKAKTGRDVSQDKKFADRILLQSAFNNLIKKLIDINYANVEEYPKFNWREEEDTDLQNKKADILVKLKQAGFQIDETEASEIFEMVLSKISGPEPGFTEKFAERKVIDKYIQEMFNQLNKV